MSINPPTANELGVIVTSARVRQIIYGVYILAGLVLGGIQAWNGAAEPHWFAQALSLYAYLGIPFGGLAIANVPTVKRAITPPTPPAA